MAQAAVDIWIVTDESKGETVPDIHEPMQNHCRCSANAPSRFLLDQGITYSFAWFGMYVDIIGWQINQVPLFSGTSFSYFVGDVPPCFCIYETPPGAKEHKLDEVNYLCQIEARAPPSR